MKPLYKTILVIWTDTDPYGMEISDLAYEAEQGSAYCSSVTRQLVQNPQLDRDWDGTEFFNDQSSFEPLEEVKTNGDV